jgi:hypothetical protein
VAHLFGSWLASFSQKHRNQILIGATALCWAIHVEMMLFSKGLLLTHSYRLFSVGHIGYN